MTDASFAARMRERYPEGLTGILAIGGTRVTFILQNNRETDDLGRIENMHGYGADMLARTRNLIGMFFDMGGQNLVIPVLSYQLFENERGQEYAQITAQMALELMNEDWVTFYRDNEIDPYFAGIDTLLHFPEREVTYRLGSECARFNAAWQYQDGRRKLIWEVAPIPLFSFWRAHEVMGEAAAAQLEADLAAAPNMQVMHDALYRYYAQAVYGTAIPYPHFYLGTNRNGDIKLRAMLPIAMTCGGPMRMFFTPYPTMFMTRETFQAILEDLAFGKRLRSTNIDYSGKLTPELFDAEYQRVIALSSDPDSTLGLSRKVELGAPQSDRR